MRDRVSLKNCLMEGEEGAGLRSPRRRGLALLLSTLLQFTLLGALILIPLLVRGERPQTTWIQPPVPIVGPKRVPPQEDGHPTRGLPPRRPPIFDRGFVAPPRIPERIAEVNDVGTEMSVPDVDAGGVYIPGAIDILDPNASRVRPLLPEPPRPEPAQEKIAVSEGVQEARLIRRVQPVYPVLAVQTRTQGTVVLRAVIGTDGAVHEVQVITGHPLLIQAALDAVMQWRYQPTLLSGRPVEVETRITVIFTLNR